MKTWVPNGTVLAERQREWFVIDATDIVLGRLCTRVANILTGKNKPTYTPYEDMGDHVIIINADKVRLTGKKLTDKMYRWHSRFPGGMKETTAGKRLASRPDRLVEGAVKGMLPKTRLGRQMAKKLKVYAGADHPHVAQQPKPVTVDKLR